MRRSRRHPSDGTFCLLALAAVLALAELAAGGAEGGPTVHTLIATECKRYFSWQTIGMAFSYRKVRQPGPMTRLMSCTAEDWERLPEEDKSLVDEIPTHWAPSYSTHPRTGDYYTGINKPVAMADWLATTDVKEDYVLVIDADMIMRLPVTPQEMGASPGTAVSGFFGYMIGVSNELALRHVPEVAPRMDEVAGPVGRRGDQVGGFTMMHREDLRRVAPLWVRYSEDVRADPLAWNQTGDVYAEEGEPCWIAEMYGYSFACSKAGVWHITAPTFQLYPGYEVGREHAESPPKVLHYGILWNVSSGIPDAEPLYSFDKHWFQGFDALACPPWELDKSGMFRHPPRPSDFNTTGYDLYRDLLAIEVIVTLNEAFCERHRRKCPASEQLERECGRAEDLARELEDAFAHLELPLEDGSGAGGGGKGGDQPAGQAADAGGAEGSAAAGNGATAAAAEGAAEAEAAPAASLAAEAEAATAAATLAAEAEAAAAAAEKVAGDSGGPPPYPEHDVVATAVTTPPPISEGDAEGGHVEL